MTTKDSNKIVKKPNIPEHCIVDNDCKLTLDDVDFDWYKELAKKHISYFLPENGEFESLPLTNLANKSNLLFEKFIKILEDLDIWSKRKS